MAPRSKQGFKREEWVQRTQQVQVIKDKVFYALTTATTIGHRQRCKFLEKVSFILKTMPAKSTGHSEPCGFLSGSVRSSFPEQGVTCYIFLHSAEVRYFYPWGFPRQRIRVAFSLHTSGVWSQVWGSKPFVVLLRTPCAHFHSSEVWIFPMQMEHFQWPIHLTMVPSASQNLSITTQVIIQIPYC